MSSSSVPAMSDAFACGGSKKLFCRHYMNTAYTHTASRFWLISLEAHRHLCLRLFRHLMHFHRRFSDVNSSKSDVLQVSKAKKIGCHMACTAFDKLTESSILSGSSLLPIGSSSSAFESSDLIFRSSLASGFVAGSEASATFSLSVGIIFGDNEFDSRSLSSGRFSPLRGFTNSSETSELSGSGEFECLECSLCDDWASVMSSVADSFWVGAAISSPSSSPGKRN